MLHYLSSRWRSCLWFFSHQLFCWEDNHKLLFFHLYTSFLYIFAGYRQNVPDFYLLFALLLRARVKWNLTNSYHVPFVCAEYWTRIGSYARRPRLFRIKFLMSGEKIKSLSNKCENSLLMSNSVHTSFYTLKLKHPAALTGNVGILKPGLYIHMFCCVDLYLQKFLELVQWIFSADSCGTTAVVT